MADIRAALSVAHTPRQLRVLDYLSVLRKSSKIYREIQVIVVHVAIAIRVRKEFSFIKFLLHSNAEYQNL